MCGGHNAMLVSNGMMDNTKVTIHAKRGTLGPYVELWSYPTLSSNRFHERSWGSGSDDCYRDMHRLKTLRHYMKLAEMTALWLISLGLQYYPRAK